MVKIIDRYIGKQVLFSTVFAVFVLSVVLVLGNVFQKLISELDRHPDLGWGFVLKFILNVLPFSLIFTIPWGLLTSILLIYGRLSADNELTSLRMAGLSLPRICAPIFAVGLLATLVTYWMNVEVAPRSQSRIAQIFFELATENPGAMFVEDEVVNTLPGYSIYTEKRELIDEATGRYKLTNLLLVKLNENKRPDIFIRAADAEIGFEDGNYDILFMKLRDAHIEKASGSGTADFIQHQMVKPGEATLQLSLAELRLKHKKSRPSFMTVPELREEIGAETDAVRKASLKTELNKRFSLSLACLTFCLIGVPLGVRAQRRETSVGFALSLIIAISYFLFIVIAEVFHENPAARPELLMWIPNVLFMSLGAFLFYRLSRR